MYERLKINYPATTQGKTAWNREYGFNAIYSGKNHFARKRDADAWHGLTAAAMHNCRCRKEPFENPVTITFLWNDRMDLSNHAYMAKMIEDAMKGRIIKDDNRKWVKGIVHLWHEEPYIEVIVEEVER